MAETIIALAVVAAFTIVASLGALFFKKGAARFSFNPLQQIKNTNLIIGLLLYIAPTPVYLWALKNANVSLLYPVNSLTFLWTSLLSVKFLGEKMNKHKWLGVASIILGVGLLAYSTVA